MKLSILICTIPEREAFLNRLLNILTEQNGDYELLINGSNQSIGAKRNFLLAEASGEYVAFIDDDDTVSEHYISHLMDGINKGVDCCSLTGIITDDGKNPRKFIHSDKYDSWFEKDNIYYRCVNHLNCIKKSIALQIGFPEKNRGEDHDYSMKLKKSGLIKTEHEIKPVIYYYEFRSRK